MSSSRPCLGPTALGKRRQELSGSVWCAARGGRLVWCGWVRACVLCVVCVCGGGCGEVGGRRGAACRAGCSHPHTTQPPLQPAPQTLPLNSCLRLPRAVGPRQGQLLLRTHRKTPKGFRK